MPRLTDQIVRKTLPPLHGQAMLWDDDLKGFGLRITTGGAKAFVLDYRAHGRQRQALLAAAVGPSDGQHGDGLRAIGRCHQFQVRRQGLPQRPQQRAFSCQWASAFA